MSKGGFVDHDGFNDIKARDLNFIDLLPYGSFGDRGELLKFMESDIGKELAASLQADVIELGVDGQLTDNQIASLLLEAQSLQYSGDMKPNLEINTDPKTAGIMPFKPIKGSPEPETKTDNSEPERVAETYSESIVTRINSELNSVVEVYDPEIEEAIQSMADKMAEAIVLSGIDLHPEDVAEAVAQGMNGYGEVELKYFAEMFNKIDVDQAVEYFVNSTPEGALVALREGPDVYMNDLGYARGHLAEVKLEDIGPSIHELAETLKESGILDSMEQSDDYERVVISAEDLQALIDEEHGMDDADREFSDDAQELMKSMKEGFNSVSGHDPDSAAEFESSARDMSVEDHSIGIAVEPNDPGLENENSDTAILYQL